MHYTPSYHTVCSHCKERQHEVPQILDVLDLAYCALDRTEVMDGTLNLLVCEYCGRSFRYETTVLAVDAKKRYAILVEPRHKGRSLALGANQFLHTIGAEGFQFRLVNYCVQMMEKARIFDSGLDDRVIELIKHLHWATHPLPDEDSYILFHKQYGDRLKFRVVDEHDTPVEYLWSNIAEYNRIAALPQNTLPTSGRNILWHMIDQTWAQTHCPQYKEETQ